MWIHLWSQILKWCIIWREEVWLSVQNSGDLLKTIVSVKAIKANQLFRVLTWQEEPWSAKPIDISWEGPVTREAPREVYKGPHYGLCCGSDWAGSTECFQGDCCSRVDCGPVTNSGKSLSERFSGRSLLFKGRNGSTLLPKLRNALHVLEVAHASSNGQNLAKSHFLAGIHTTTSHSVSKTGRLPDGAEGWGLLSGLGCKHE